MIQKLYLNEAEAAARYGYSRAWFQRKRWEGGGPQYLKANSSKGGKILYPLQATDQWFAGIGLQSNTSQTIQNKEV